MEKAYLTPRLFKVYVTFYNERTSYNEPLSHTHLVGAGAVHSLAWARHIGRIAAGYDGHYEIFEHDCGDWIRVDPYQDREGVDHDLEIDFPW